MRKKAMISGTMGTGEDWGWIYTGLFSYFFIVMKKETNKFGCSQVSGERIRRVAEWNGVGAIEFNSTQYNPWGLTKPEYKWICVHSIYAVTGKKSEIPDNSYSSPAHGNFKFIYGDCGINLMRRNFEDINIQMKIYKNNFQLGNYI